jgi:hypothetical protein
MHTRNHPRRDQQEAQEEGKRTIKKKSRGGKEYRVFLSPPYKIKDGKDRKKIAQRQNSNDENPLYLTQISWISLVFFSDALIACVSVVSINL